MKIKNKGIIIITVTLTISIVAVIAYFAIAPYYRTIYSGNTYGEVIVSNEEEMLLNFIRNKLTDESGGIYTNYIDSKNKDDITKGHAILSESQGIMLLYNVEKDNKEEFDHTLNYVKQNMTLDSKLVSWRIDKIEKSNVSATIDDLRIIKSLFMASERWNDRSYRKLAIDISKGIRHELLNKNTLVDFNDGISKSETTTLCYLDLPTLKMLANIDYISWEKIYNESLSIINSGYISDSIPLYAKTYNNVGKYYDEEDIDTLLSMIVILNKAEVGEDIDTSVGWIKNKLRENKKIAITYARSTGEATSNIESTAIYSIILQIGSLINDEDLETMAMEKVRSFQVKNENSEIYGGYGSENGKEVFSYDNLNALLAYRSNKK